MKNNNMTEQNEQILKATRDGFGVAVAELAKNDRNIIVLSADLSPSLKVDNIRIDLSGQFIECGVAEQNMVGVASGMALSGKIPFTTSFAEFLTGRAWEQIRIDVCYNNANVKLAGSHAGLSTGQDGATHQILEDIALMRSLPNMTIFSPCDFNEAYKVTIQAARINGPVYIRLTRPSTPIITPSGGPFEIGKISSIKEGRGVIVLGTGPVLSEVVKAVDGFEERKEEIGIYSVHTIKPIDKDKIIELAKGAKAIVTIEDHQLIGGLGSAVAEVLADSGISAPLRRLGVNDSFGESGTYQELWRKHGMDSNSIQATLREFLV
jgi:transketolase